MSARASRRSADDLMAGVGAALAPVFMPLVRDAVRGEIRVGGDADTRAPHRRWPCNYERELARRGLVPDASLARRGRR